MEGNSRILLVEDDPVLARELLRHLQRGGWVADHVACLAHAFEAIVQASYRVLLLDRRLPDGDGLALVSAARSRPHPPAVIVLTARDDIADRVEGLDAGADDYLVKPFAVAELFARLRAACRRPAACAAAPALAVGQLAFDSQSREVRVRDAPLAMPRRELVLLEALVHRVGRVVQREFLESAVYGHAADVSPNALETQVSRLRRRLLDAAAGVEIVTIRGVGYLLRSDPACSAR